MEPKDVAAAIRRLREGSLALLDGLTDAELTIEALPGWSVLDVFRHLATSDRGSVLGVHLLHFRPGRDFDAFERVNDDLVAEVRDEARGQVRDDLATWGSRLATITGLVPRPLAKVMIPTAFGRVPLSWMGGLRLYDEWVHQRDVTQALGRPDPPMDDRLRGLLAEFQLRALPGGPLRQVDHRDGVVELRFRDVDRTPWRFDLRRHEFGAFVRAAPTVSVVADVPSWCLLAGARRSWRELPGIEVTGRDEAAAAALLDVVRVV
ncbi:MAG: maleylpyruvate isomerase N-terminal domain-containing protein [Actinobacteria bacterium]|nr:maleylpyruvate isomerase N-terminal domain-containing protein [Actinomycetota bacterium]